MAITYKRPGVYLEESIQVNPGTDIASTVSVGGFVGVTQKGPGNTPILVDSWNSFVSIFGSFGLIQPPGPEDPNDITTTALAGRPQPATLAALKADPVVGDGDYEGSAFTAGQYVMLLDDSKAHYATNVWTSGALAGTGAAVVAEPPLLQSYMSYAVYSFFQNGGRLAWIIRSVPEQEQKRGVQSSVDVIGVDTEAAFTLNAISAGVWGDDINYRLVQQNEVNGESIFALQIMLGTEVVETFSSLSMSGTIPGTRRVDVAINDPNSNAGSRYVVISDMSLTQKEPAPTPDPVALADGVDPATPTGADLESTCRYVGQIEGPINLNIVGYLKDAAKENTSDVVTSWVTGVIDPPTEFPDREDVVYFNDSAPPRFPNQTPTAYINDTTNGLVAKLGVGTNSYSASYGPWILIPDPSSTGNTIAVPPAGAVIGMAARIDATMGVFRAPAGVVADIFNAVGVQTKFTDAELGDLNAQNINVVRTVVGAGVCVMGARTRKNYGPDRYLSARRTLISIKESLRASTQWAVFENNDEMLWSGLAMTADRILRPLWEVGGLKGSTAEEAYYVRCDETINTATVIQAGEVRMEVGVALQYPAEFVIIKITQFEEGTFTTEVQPLS